MNLKIKIILVETSHPGNIGSVARAMKTMGLSKLSLVNPKDFPSGDANALSGNARDVLDSAIIYYDSIMYFTKSIASQAYTTHTIL